MRKLFKISILLSLLAIFAFRKVVFAQHSEISVEILSIENGISQSFINCLMLDSTGYLWIGTQDGLNKYDGTKFIVFRHDPMDSNSLPNNYIRTLYQDKNRNIWIATQFGLSKFDIRKNKFINFLHHPKNPNSISDNDVYSIFQDKKGKFWVKTLNSIEKFDTTKHKFFHFPHYNHPFSYADDYSAYYIFEDSRHQLWATSKDGVVYFDKNSEQCLHPMQYNELNPKSLSDNNVLCYFEDKEKNLWYGTKNGLNKWIPKTRTFKRFFFNENDNVITAIYQDSKGQMWLGTENGLYKFSPETESRNELIINGKTVMKTRVNCILEDNSKILWVGTYKGLYKFNSQKRKFHLHRKNENNFPNFSDNNISAIFVNQNGLIFIGTRHNGLNLYNRKTGEVLHFDSENSNLKNDDINVIFQDRKKNIFIGTSNGIMIFDPETHHFSTFDEIFETETSLTFKNNRIYCIAEDRNNVYWFGTQNGLFRLKNNEFRKIFSANNCDTCISPYEVYSLLVDSKNNVWVGTRGGLNKFNYQTKKFQRFSRNSLPHKGLSNNSVLCIHEDSRGMIWIGTESGLNRFNPIDETFNYYTYKNGFKNDYIYSILEDNKNNLWISTNRGLSKFSIISEKITNYDLEDGLQNYEFNIGAAFKSQNGEMFFGGINGFNSFFPDSIVKNPHIPQVIITKLEKIDYQGVKHNLFLENSNEIILSYRDYNLYIEFAVLEYTSPEKNIYQYKMENLDAEWLESQNQHSAMYPKLPPGEYEFKVMGTNNDHVWVTEPTTLKIKVLPPWWKKWWAYLLYFWAGTGIIVGIFFEVTHNLRKSNQELKERERTRKEIEQQKEELSIKNQNITDSINYAKRIIDAMMPSDKIFKRILPNSFILYRPKDIVSGDFYWIAQRDEKIFVAAVDCTGHGVPGALMSIIGFDLLRNLTIEQSINEAAQILNRLNQEVAKRFNKEVDEMVRDGMDIAFCVINQKEKYVEFAGAVNPLLLIRNDSIIEYKGDRFSVGAVEHDELRQFRSHRIEMQKNDMIYLFSDGYIDQFGGPFEKKFKFRKFCHLLLNIYKLDLEEQRKALENAFLVWKGELEQVDDVLIIGIRF